MVLGLLLTVPVSFGDLDVGPVTLSLNWQFLGVAILVVGSQAFFLGCIAQVLFDYTGPAQTALAAGVPVHPHGAHRLRARRARRRARGPAAW